PDNRKFQSRRSGDELLPHALRVGVRIDPAPRFSAIHTTVSQALTRYANAGIPGSDPGLLNKLLAPLQLFIDIESAVALDFSLWVVSDDLCVLRDAAIFFTRDITS